MLLSSLMENVEYISCKGSLNVEVSSLAYDSRKCEKDCVFVCIKGAKFDSHNCIDEICKKKAKAIIVEEDIKDISGITVIKVKNTRLALANMSASYFGNPARKLKTIGITGTKGKTTTTYMIKSILEKAGYKVGLIGTIEIIIGNKKIESINTTPESFLVQKYFNEMVNEGMDCVVMEVSSQGLMQNRTSGFVFDYGIVTNIEADHIGPNEHKNFEEYLHCKSLLLQNCKIGIVNKDDKYFKDIIKNRKCRLSLYGFEEEAHFVAKNYKNINMDEFLGVKFEIDGILNENIYLALPGKFSIYNSLAAIALGSYFEVSKDNIKSALKEISIKGRSEIIKGDNNLTIIIDYAHNAISLENLLLTLKEYKHNRIITVFGCVGGRTELRRRSMGEVSGKLSDLTIITSDNPGYEDPKDIAKDIANGVRENNGEYTIIVDRESAIRHAIKNGQEGDIIVLAGKGHESYQEVRGNKIYFNEREVVESIIIEAI